jgi:tetratricopeptide (TPR) repeat protein
MDAYLIAGDGAAAQRLVDSSAAFDLPTAIGLQRRILASVESQPLRVKDQAEAWWRLGQLEQSVAYRLPGAQRSAGERAVLDAYEHAHANAPLDEKYLLAAANGALNLGDLATARVHFEQLLALDGGSIDSTLGLADTLLRAGDSEAARPLIDRAAALGAGARADALRRRLP